MTGIVNTLEKHGYIFKQECSEDGRSVRIGLTEKGWAIKKDFEEISTIVVDRFYGSMPENDKERLVELLSTVEKNLKQ